MVLLLLLVLITLLIVYIIGLLVMVGTMKELMNCIEHIERRDK